MRAVRGESRQPQRLEQVVIARTIVTRLRIGGFVTSLTEVTLMRTLLSVGNREGREGKRMASLTHLNSHRSPQ